MWVSALRSGKYRKAKGSLKQNGGYCCLGVLTNLYIRKTGKGRWVKDGSSIRFVSNTSQEGGTLPSEVSKWAGIKGSNQMNPHLKNLILVGDSHYDNLVGLNDDTRKNFKFIAEVIDKQL